MDDIEKIIKAWERCRECRSLPIGMSEAWVECEYTIGLYCAQDKLVNDTIKLLKSIQEDRNERTERGEDGASSQKDNENG